MEMTLTLNTRIIHLISCLYLLTFRSQAAMVSKKSLFSLFLYSKAQVKNLQNLTLP